MLIKLTRISGALYVLVSGVLGGRWSGADGHVTSRLALIGGTSACHMAVSHPPLLYIHTLTCLSSVTVYFCNSLPVSLYSGMLSGMLGFSNFVCLVPLNV